MFFLIKWVEKTVRSEELDQILQSPNDAGETLFLIASIFTEEIAKTDSNDDACSRIFENQSLTEKMLEKDVNP